MSLAAVDQDDYQVIGNLVEGLEVLQIGCHQGHDTMTLARGAARVIAVGQREGLPVGGFRSQVEQWHVIQRFYGTGERTLLLTDAVASVLTSFVPGQFDVAVVDYSAWPAQDPFGLIPVAYHLAAKIIVLGMTSMDLRAEVAQVAVHGAVIEQSGHLTVIDRPGPAAGDESKGDG